MNTIHDGFGGKLAINTDHFSLNMLVDLLLACLLI